MAGYDDHRDRVDQPVKQRYIHNTMRTWTTASILLTAAGILMIVAGMMIDDFNFYWLILVGFLISLTFLILSLMFASQARRLDRLFSRDSELLAHWTFDATQQETKVEKEYQTRKSTNRVLLLVVLFFFIVIGGLFLVFGFDDLSEAGLFLVIMLGVLGSITLAALLAPKIARRHMRRSPPEVFIGPYSAWIMGEYTQWKAPMTRLNKVLLCQDERALIIDIDFSILQRYGYQQHHCRIPVAAGHEDEAGQAAMRIASTNNVVFVPLATNTEA